jgi:hypothetical protein
VIKLENFVFLGYLCDRHVTYETWFGEISLCPENLLDS